MFCSKTLKFSDRISSVNAINWSSNQTLITAIEHEVVWRAVNKWLLRPDLLDFLLFRSIGSKFLHFRKKIAWFMYKCNRSPCAVWVVNCELLSEETFESLCIINEQFSKSRVDSEPEGNKHHRQVHQPFLFIYLFIYFFTSHQGRVYFVIKFFRLEVPNRRKIW